MGGRSYGAEEKAKLERLIAEGSTVLREVEDGFLAFLARDLVGLRDIDGEQQAHRARMIGLADLLDDLAETQRRALGARQLSARGEEVAEVALRHLVHRLDAVGARNPDRRRRLRRRSTGPT